jgi:chemotaxis protein methyltransferase CheR
MPDRLSINDEKLFLDLLTRRTGLRVPEDDYERFDDALAQRAQARGCDSVLGYYNLLESGSRRADEFKELAKLFTVGETYFFRSTILFKAIKSFILPAVIDSRRKTGTDGVTPRDDSGQPALSMNIWSAGCATGEEPYSVAITLKEVLPDYPYWKVKIAGTDINEDSLTVAEKALYTSHSLRGVPDHHLKSHFSATNADYQLRHEIRDMVKFSYGNLAEPYFPSPFGPDVPADLIVCRNVLMYFERPVAEEILFRFYEILRPGGYLVLGTTESVTDETIGFERMTHRDAYFYRKPLPARKQEKAEAETRPFSLADHIPGAAPPTDEITTESRESTRARSAFRMLKALLEKNPNDPAAHFQLAKLYANRARFQMAMQECEDALQIDPLFALPYLLLGIIHYRSDEHEMAGENLRRALYNDKTLTLARFYLARAFRETGETKRALAEFKAVISELETKPPREIVYQSDGFTSQALLKLARTEIAALQDQIRGS